MRLAFPVNVTEFRISLRREVAESIASKQVEGVRGEFTLWTHAVKQWLAVKARSLDFRPIYTDREGTTEFMLDLVWWEQGPGGSAVLACEIEWGNTRDPRRNYGRVAEDFDKLLSFKAPFKLMIFDSYSSSQTQTEVINELTRYLQEYGDHRLGEQYLIMDMAPNGYDWYCRILQDGENPQLSLEILKVTTLDPRP